ncbi:MAG TPA: glycosyltransferase [Actinophytocola sp.]|uniref:glycosyltransferase family 2 protein n=1 Tax=Actinophytocola sp. TaxID=1872138 RepID=UPI002DB583E3|nr:glycosyltransferase [Actinophytocola sp.]HEU5473563.1 glycosyltransferase [Actinophytocola sp.]
MTDNRPEVAIVIPTRNKAGRLRLTLACLAEQRDAPPVEVVLVDDGSTDGTRGVAAAADLPVRVVGGPGRGRAAARNAGAAAATAGHLVFVDDDILVGPDFVAAHLAAAGPDRFVHGPLRELVTADRLVVELAGASDTEIRARRDALLDGSAGRRYRLFGNALERTVEAMALGWLPDVAPWLGSVGANVGLPAAAWRTAGGFDEGFGTTWGCEDLELGYRLHACGVRREFAVQAHGIHLTHRRPDRWEQHDVNLDRFRRLHPVPAVHHLDRLLGPDGDANRYVDSVRAADRETVRGGRR